MRKRIIDYLKLHNGILQVIYLVGHCALKLWGFFLPIQPKRMVFASYGGRKFDDSPKAIYDAVCKDSFFDDWELVWAFVDTKAHDLPRGNKITIDTPLFFKYLLTSKVWVSNSGMDRNLGICKKRVIDIETFHGTPIKKTGREQNQGSTVAVRWAYNQMPRIRCAQSEYDLAILMRTMVASKEEFLLNGLPRNDELANASKERIDIAKKNLSLPEGKKIILYMPTYREYLTDEKDACYIAPPINLSKWRDSLSDQYILLFRAHYAVTKLIGIVEDDFIRDVSNYPSINDLYLSADILISDYSSAFIDYSILKRPMLCFAYDLEEYKEKRGLYIDLEKELPCPVDRDEDTIINRLLDMNYAAYSIETEKFHKKYSPHAGNASEAVINKLKEQLYI